MRSVFFLIAAATAATKSKPSDHEFITTGSAYQFMKDTVLLSFDVTFFAARRLQMRVMTFVPEEQQKMFSDIQTQVYTQCDKQREGLGLPAFDKLHDSIQNQMAEYTAMFTDVVYSVNEKIELLGSPAQQKLDLFFEDFVKLYPDAPGLPKGLVDRIFIILFVSYILLTVFRYAKCAFCLPFRILGCICCRGGDKQAQAKGGRYNTPAVKAKQNANQVQTKKKK